MNALGLSFDFHDASAALGRELEQAATVVQRDLERAAVPAVDDAGLESGGGFAERPAPVFGLVAVVTAEHLHAGTDRPPGAVDHRPTGLAAHPDRISGRRPGTPGSWVR